MIKYITTGFLAGFLMLMITVPQGVVSDENLEDAGQPSPAIQTSVTIPEYRLGFGDVIEVKFFNNERFNEMITVRPDGRIAMERMGEIFVAGLTPLELDDLITAEYSRFIQNPDVTIFVREFSGYQVYVLGRVNTPGGYPVQRNMTLLQAIAAAGGTSVGAKLQSVVVLRRGKEDKVDAFKVNLKAVVKRDKKAVGENDLYMQPLDIVYVPETVISSMSTFLTQVYSGFMPPVDVYLRALWWSERGTP